MRSPVLFSSTGEIIFSISTQEDSTHLFWTRFFSYRFSFFIRALCFGLQLSNKAPSLVLNTQRFFFLAIFPG